MSEKKDKLKPCPFCGSDAEQAQIGNNHTKTRSVKVKCSNKSCRFERTDSAIQNDIEWLEVVSTEAWNTRAEQEEYKKYEFCEDMECFDSFEGKCIDRNRQCVAVDLYSWLKRNNYKIIKEKE